MINCEQAVNHILDKFRSTTVTFVCLTGWRISVKIGGQLYVVYLEDTYRVGHCERLLPDPSRPIMDNYSLWVQGVLNGLARNEAGELV